MSDRPRLLLVPSISELEWGRILPLLGEWAEVVTYDIPGLSEAEPSQPLDADFFVAGGVQELERLGWSEAILVGDQFGSALAVLVSETWRGDVRGLALGHACLTYTREGPRPAISAIAADFQLQLTRLGRVQADQMFLQGVEMTYGSDVAAGIRARLSPSFTQQYAQLLLDNQDIDLEPRLRELGAPLFFAQHKECGLWMPEGFEDAVAAFPDARTLVTEENPGSSPDFAAELREFAEAVWRGVQRP
jgi:pimeloyl-ACP methyl ester carboxylesterase